jgi:hypothetical protein
VIPFVESIFAIATGFIGGTIYGLLFIRAKALCFAKPHLTHLLTSARLLGLALFLFYILHSSRLHSILLIITFFAAFWFIVIKKSRVH